MKSFILSTLLLMAFSAAANPSIPLSAQKMADLKSVLSKSNIQIQKEIKSKIVTVPAKTPAKKVEPTGTRSSLGGGQEGNGGDGLYMNRKLYLLDLVEAGLEENPIIDEKVSVSPSLLSRIETKLDPKRFPTKLIAQKMAEISDLNIVFAYSLLQALELYTWRIVSSQLVDIKDEHSPLHYREKSIVQLAARVQSSVLVDESLWKKLDVKNQTALIFHELLYALVRPNYVKSAETGDYLMDPLTGEYTGVKEQSSPRAREVNGYIFSSDLARQGSDGLNRMLGGDFPLGGPDRLILENANLLNVFDTLHIEIKIPDWQNIDFGLELSSGPEEVQNYAAKACEIASRSRLPLVIEWRNDVYHIQLSQYKSQFGDKNFVEVSSADPNVGTFLEAVKFETQPECSIHTTQSLLKKLEQIKTNYRRQL